MKGDTMKNDAMTIVLALFGAVTAILCTVFVVGAIFKIYSGDIEPGTLKAYMLALSLLVAAPGATFGILCICIALDAKGDTMKERQAYRTLALWCITIAVAFLGAYFVIQTGGGS